MIIRKTVAMILLSSVLFGMAFGFASCKKNKNNEPRSSNVIIKEEDPWYKANIYDPCEIMDPYDEVDSPSFYSTVVGDKLFVVKTGSRYFVNSDDYSCVMLFGLFDLEGNHICQYMMDLGYLVSIADIVGVTAEGDNLNINYMVYEYSGYKLYSVNWDTVSNTVSEPVQTDLGLQEEYFMQAVQSDNILAASYTQYHDDDSEIPSYYKMFIDIFDDTEHLGHLDISETDFKYIYMNNVYDTGDKIIIDGEDWDYHDYYSGEKTRIIFDKATRTFEDVSRYYSDGLGNTVTGFDGRLYTCKYDGIYCGDELYLSYTECDTDLIDMYSLKLVRVEEDKVILSGKDLFQDFSVGFRIIVLEKQNRNPNAGKMLINALSVTELKKEEFEAIIRYNRADNKYFIKPVVKSVTELEQFTPDRLQEYYDSISQEIKSETGPDLVFNSYVLSNFLNDDYFLDMSKEIEFDDSEYYSELYDITATDGKHYMIPSGFLLNGVMAPKDCLREDQCGFTFDEYKEFVTTSCEDIDPIYYSHTRKRYLELLLNAMSNSWLKDGKVDFNTEEFRSILTFVKEFVPVTEYEDDHGYFTEYMNQFPYDKKTPQYYFLYSAFFGNYTSELIRNSDLKLIGTPSYEGSGPDAQILSSVSVCANTGVMDACIDFIKYLLSTEIQLNNQYISVNKTAMSMLQSDNYQKDAKEFKDNLATFQSEAQDRDDDYYTPLKKTQNRLDSLTDDFERADIYDMAVVYIILEESRGYLDGEKDLDTVISSINIKVQAYLDSL